MLKLQLNPEFSLKCLRSLILKQVAYAVAVLGSTSFDCGEADASVDEFCINNNNSGNKFLSDLNIYCNTPQKICPNPSQCCSDFTGRFSEFITVIRHNTKTN